MQMFRNMEVVLMLCFGLIVTAGLLAQPTPADETMRVQDNGAAPMPVVVITGKRLSATEKAKAINEAG